MLIRSRDARPTLAVLAALMLMLTACAPNSDTTDGASDNGSPTVDEQPPAPEPVDLTGDWEQSNKNSEDSYQAATITTDAIEIYWITDGGDSRSLYWAGSVDVPDDGSESFTWESENDTNQTENALLASDAPTKTFTYEAGEISYEVSALGTTTTVRLAQD